MKIAAHWSVDFPAGIDYFEIEDFGCTISEWNSFSEKEKEEKIQKAIDKITTPPAMFLDNWRELNN